MTDEPHLDELGFSDAEDDSYNGYGPYVNQNKPHRIINGRVDNFEFKSNSDSDNDDGFTDSLYRFSNSTSDDISAALDSLQPSYCETEDLEMETAVTTAAPGAMSILNQLQTEISTDSAVSLSLSTMPAPPDLSSEPGESLQPEGKA